MHPEEDTTYRLSSLNPEPLKKSLDSSGQLDLGLKLLEHRGEIYLEDKHDPKLINSEDIYTNKDRYVLFNNENYKSSEAVAAESHRIRLDSFNVLHFNFMSARQQIAAGVDPDDCLSLVEVPGDEVVPLGDYFDNLIDKKYAVPIIGTYRDHDIDTHVQAVKKFHPDIVKVLVAAAKNGKEILNSGDKNSAVAIGDAIDVMLTESKTVWTSKLLDLMTLVGHKGHSSEVSTEFHALVKTQDLHEKALAEVSKKTLFKLPGALILS